VGDAEVLGDVIDYDGVLGWLFGGLDVEHIFLIKTTNWYELKRTHAAVRVLFSLLLISNLWFMLILMLFLSFSIYSFILFSHGANKYRCNKSAFICGLVFSDFISHYLISSV